MTIEHSLEHSFALKKLKHRAYKLPAGCGALSLQIEGVKAPDGRVGALYDQKSKDGAKEVFMDGWPESVTLAAWPGVTFVLVEVKPIPSMQPFIVEGAEGQSAFYVAASL